jgi:Tol biopolymer transport system component
MKCPDCHQEHTEGTQFCPHTGRQINLSASRTLITPKNKTGSPLLGWLIISLGVVCSQLILVVGIFIAFWNGTGQAGVNPVGTLLPASASAGPGRIVFVSDRDGNSEIYVMDADGSHPTRLTYSHAQTKNNFPAWSPDGQKIAFVSTRDGTPEIHVMNSDGSQQTRLTDHQESASSYRTGAFHPAWSSDGTKLAFVSGIEGEYKICIMNADGSAQTCLAGTNVEGLFISFLLDSQIVSLEYDQLGVSWSPDGERLVYSSSRSGTSKIYLLAADGSAQSYLINDPGGFDPNWSPDGRKIAFVSFWDGGYQIFVANADGSASTALTHEKDANSFSPGWSGDGRKIVFTSNRTGNYEIYVMNADGSQPTRLTDTQVQNWSPDWSR